MKADSVSRTTLQDILLYMLAYLLWLVNVAVCIVAVFEIRSTLNVLWVMTGHSRYTLGLADQLSVLLGGLAAFVYVVFLETFYRRSVTHRDQISRASGDASTPTQVSPHSPISQWQPRPVLLVLLRRFAWTIAIPIGLLLVSLVMRQVAWRGFR